MVVSRALCVIALSLIAGFVTPVTAQKKGGKPTTQPAVLSFRCPSVDCTGTDRIVGDGSDYQGTGVPETGQGAHWNTNNELWLGFGQGVYQLFLDFSQIDGVAPCSTSGTCRLPALTGPIIEIDQENGEFQSNVLANGQPSANGLLDVVVGQTARTRLKISFGDPLGRVLWGLNFNTIDYAGATNINVMRTDQCTWVFEPGENDRGGLHAYGSMGKGKAVRTDEGLYNMPFKMTFRVAGMC